MTSLINTLSFNSSACSVLHACCFALHLMLWLCPFYVIQFQLQQKAWEVGILFARDVGIRDVEFEGDPLEVCNALQGLTSPPSSVANVLSGFLNLVSHFRQWKVSHIKRPCPLTSSTCPTCWRLCCMA